MSNRAYRKGVRYEQLFMELTGATERQSEQSDLDHIDCNLSGFTVDVKGNKRSHRHGYVLVEILNVQGKAGWCHPDSGADKIAFFFDEGVYVVDRRDLYHLTSNLVMANNKDVPVLRKNKVPYKKGLYRLIGRTTYKGRPRKDVFTYILKDDLLTLDYEFYEQRK